MTHSEKEEIEGYYGTTSWRTMGCKERSLRTEVNAGMASSSCICPNANAASCANKFDESLVAAKEKEKLVQNPCNNTLNNNH
jgi:hypothetical protein